MEELINPEGLREEPAEKSPEHRPNPLPEDMAGLTAFLVSRTKAAPGGRTSRFVILFSCGSIVLESMLHSGEIVHLPWLGFVKANQILCAAALLGVLISCVRRLNPGERFRPALAVLLQFLAAIGVIVVLEFTTFEKKIEFIEWLPADACHLIIALMCLWIALAFRSVWKKAYGVSIEERNERK